MRVMSLNQDIIYAHYVELDRYGALVSLYACDHAWSIKDGFTSFRYLFGPVLCGVNPPVRHGDWTIVGALPPPPDYRHPAFLSMSYGKPPHRPYWWLYDGKDERRIGTDVPEEFKPLELLSVWPAVLIEERLRSGTNTDSYYTRMRALGFEP
jgi:hypothetical protein